MSATENTSTGYRVRGWHVLVGMIAFFGVITAVNAVMITLALESFPGQVSVTPYEDGVAYNKKLAQMEAQARLGWRASAGVEGRTVVVHMRDSSDAPISGLRMTGLLQRPATESGKVTTRFEEGEPGVYRAKPGGLAGAWDLTVNAVDAKGRTFEAERRLMWP